MLTERQKAWKRNWNTKPENKAKNAKQSLAYYHKHREWRRFVERLREKRITLDQFHSKAESQDFLCAICQASEVGRKNSSALLYIDHDHGTGHIRGLLCHHCNDALGKFKDDIELLEKAIAYLKRHRKAA